MVTILPFGTLPGALHHRSPSIRPAALARACLCSLGLNRMESQLKLLDMVKRRRRRLCEKQQGKKNSCYHEVANKKDEIDS